MDPTPVTGMSTIITNITSMVTAAVDWVSSFLGMITTSGNELLLVVFLLPIVGVGIGLLRRLVKIKG